MTGYEVVANAVIEQAAKDYRSALKKLKRNPDNEAAGIMKKDCEDFFQSSNFNRFTKIDGEMLMSKPKEEFEK